MGLVESGVLRVAVPVHDVARLVAREVMHTTVSTVGVGAAALTSGVEQDAVHVREAGDVAPLEFL